MSHNKTTLAIASIVVAVALAGVASTTPQQVLAGGHHNHKHNSVKVDQQINQLNNCTGTSSDDTGQDDSPTVPAPINEGEDSVSAPTVCLNSASNSADIHG
jgi:hypothetical protein